MGGSSSRDCEEIPEWSFRGSRRIKYYFKLLDYVRPWGFRGRFFNSEADVLRFFEERGVKITGVTLDPDPSEYISEAVCESLLGRYAEALNSCNPAGGLCKNHGRRDAEACIKFHNKFSKDIVKTCGFHIDGVEPCQPERRN